MLTEHALDGVLKTAAFRSLAFLAAVFAIAAPVTTLRAASNECIEIDNNLDRLACYDRESGRTPQQRTIPKRVGKWIAHTQALKSTDDIIERLAVMSTERIDCGLGKMRVFFEVRCRESATSWIFLTGCHVASNRHNDHAEITYKLDESKARTVRGDRSTDRSLRGFGLWQSRQAIPVIKQMFDKSKMVARISPRGADPFTATFDISGLKEAISPLRNACHW